MGNFIGRSNQEDIFVALFDFCNDDLNCLTLIKGRRYKIIDKVDDIWWNAEDLVTREKGFVLFNYVAQLGSLESQNWFIDIDRFGAEQLVKQHENPLGTFLVRPSTLQDEYALTIKSDEKNHKNEFKVKHYRIQKNKEGYYIGNGRVYKTLPDLVFRYSKSGSRRFGLQLHVPCQRPEPPVAELPPEIHQNWELDRNHITIIKQIGEGNFATVYFGKYKQTNDIAIKSLKNNAELSEIDFLKEVDVMKKMRHKHIVRLFGVCTDQVPYLIIQEYMSNGCLLAYLNEQIKKSVLPPQQLAYMASQVASGMKYLEEKNFIHRDLAARNILIAANHSLKIGDFGLARCISAVYFSTTSMPAKWAALESLNDQICSIKSDVWSFGILMMEIFTYGETPYPKIMHSDVLISKLKKGYRMEKPLNHNLPENIYDLMLKCWDAEPENRPTFEYLYSFLCSLISDGIYNDI